MRVIQDLARVQHVGVAGDRADARVGEALHELAQRVGLERAVGVDERDDLRAGRRMPAAIAARLPRFSGKSITRTRGSPSATDVDLAQRAVRGAVVDDHELELLPG